MKATILPRVPGTAHVILEITDDGTPSLTSYRRVIVTIKPAAKPEREAISHRG